MRSPAALTLPRVPDDAGRGGGCPVWRLAQQCRTPLPHSRGRVPGRLALVHRWGGVKSTAPSPGAGAAAPSLDSCTLYCTPLRAPSGTTGPKALHRNRWHTPWLLSLPLLCPGIAPGSACCRFARRPFFLWRASASGVLDCCCCTHRSELYRCRRLR